MASFSCPLDERTLYLVMREINTLVAARGKLSAENGSWKNECTIGDLIILNKGTYARSCDQIRTVSNSTRVTYDGEVVFESDGQLLTRCENGAWIAFLLSQNGDPDFELSYNLNVTE